MIEPGCYVVAVSGGVDSMVLLDIVRQLPQLRLVVAHFDHGIRPDAAKDRELVAQVAQQYGLPFVYDEGNLGAQASEAVAREARYNFLDQVRVASRAQAILTAHHQDDMLETAIINIIRGTGRRGLSSLRSRGHIARPLLVFNKEQIRRYAKAHDLTWHEDSTNTDQKYLRNYVRHRILNRLSDEQQAALLAHINTAKDLNDDIDSILQAQLHLQPAVHKLDRVWFSSLRNAVACEVMASWLRGQGVTFDTKMIHRLVVAAKTLAPGKRVDITKGVQLTIGRTYLALTRSDR